MKMAKKHRNNGIPGIPGELLFRYQVPEIIIEKYRSFPNTGIEFAPVFFSNDFRIVDTGGFHPLRGDKSTPGIPGVDSPRQPWERPHRKKRSPHNLESRR